jgi:hypothetical protein
VITPDDKNWTWVIERPCPECGFDASTTAATEVPGLVRDNTAAFQAFLARGVLTPIRPDDSTWSPLEYACHVRDVYRRYLGRIDLMLEQDDPLFPNWDQDATAAEDDYLHQDPTTAVAELTDAGEVLAVRLERVSDHAWERTGRRSDGAAFTLDTISRYMVHDVIHHVADIEG